MKTLLKKVFTPFEIFLSISIALFQIIILRYVYIEKSQNKLYVLSDGGFGHTVVAPDLCYNLYGNNIIIILSEFQRHNKFLSYFWKNIEVYHVHKLFFLKTKFVRDLTTNLIIRFIQIVLTKNIEIIKDSSKDIIYKNHILFYDKFIEKIDVKLNTKYMPSGTEWLAYWSHYKNNTNISSLKIPQKYVRYYNYFEGINKKVITIYCREKGRDITSTTRIGMEISDYIEIFSMLVSKNFQIFIVGDRLVDENIRDKFNIIDFKSFPIPKKLFDILAVFKAEYVISDPGGGSFLPILLNKKHLIINCFPYGFSLPNTSILYKEFYIENKLINFHEALNKYYWKYSSENDVELRSASKKLILNSIKHFTDQNKSFINTENNTCLLKINQNIVYNK